MDSPEMLMGLCMPDFLASLAEVDQLTQTLLLMVICQDDLVKFQTY